MKSAVPHSQGTMRFAAALSGGAASSGWPSASGLGFTLSASVSTAAGPLGGAAATPRSRRQRKPLSCRDSDRRLPRQCTGRRCPGGGDIGMPCGSYAGVAGSGAGGLIGDMKAVTP